MNESNKVSNDQIIKELQQEIRDNARTYAGPAMPPSPYDKLLEEINTPYTDTERTRHLHALYMMRDLPVETADELSRARQSLSVRIKLAIKRPVKKLIKKIVRIGIGTELMLQIDEQIVFNEAAAYCIKALQQDVNALREENKQLKEENRRLREEA